MSDFSAILLDTSVNFLVVSGSTWQNSIRHVFHVQMRSSFAGKWRQSKCGFLLRRERGRPQNVSFPSSSTPKDTWRT